ncbi:MAG: FAD binding domain-containing protein [Alphaproteobacteria bacterium]|nr:FAD binding domain-containing protein [Alphaproteobacteria bacterium]
MLRMPEFRYHNARSADEAVSLWSELGGAEGRGKDAVWSAMYVAGGTDLLPNIKHRLFTPKHLIGLGGLPRPTLGEADGHLIIDAGVRLDTLANDPLVRAKLPPLAEAAGKVAGPQIRRMGTIGGNVLLDTRCLFYNQTEFWRKALGYCLKKEGTWCHVIGGPKTCVAAQSSDTVPVLLALDASIDLRSAEGERSLQLRDLYQFNGFDHLKLEPGELLTRVRVPLPGAGFRGRYSKLRVRGAIDFPQVGVAVTGTFEGDTPSSLEIVVGAINPQPKPVRKLEAFLGKPLDAEAIEGIAELVGKQTRPQSSVAGDTGWRRAMAGIMARRALTELVAG